MEQINWLYIPSALISIGVIVSAVTFFINSLRQGSAEAQKESNDILRKLLEDQKLEIESIKQSHAEAMKKISSLDQEVKLLKGQKNDLESIMVKALNQYFESHPEQIKKFALTTT